MYVTDIKFKSMQQDYYMNSFATSFVPSVIKTITLSSNSHSSGIDDTELLELTRDRYFNGDKLRLATRILNDIYKLNMNEEQLTNAIINTFAQEML